MKKDFSKTSPDWFQKVGDPATCPSNDKPKLGSQVEYSDASSPLLLKVTRSKSGGLHRRFFLRIKINGQRQFHDIWKDGDPRPLPGIAELQAAATSMRDALLGKGAHTIQKKDAIGKTLSDAFDDYQAHRVLKGKKKQRTADRARAMFDLHVPAHVQQLAAVQVDENVIIGVVAGVKVKKGKRNTGEVTKDEVQKLLVPVVNRVLKKAKMAQLDEDELPREPDLWVREIELDTEPGKFRDQVGTLLRFFMERAATKPDEATGIDLARAEGMRQTGRLALLLLSTGMRSTEARSLRWEHIDLERGTLHHPSDDNEDTGQPGTKTGEPLDLPLTGWQVAILRDQANQGTDWVFPGKTATGPGFEADGGLRALFRQLNKLHGLDLTPHQMRDVFSEFATEQCGVPETIVDALTNHSGGKQTVTKRSYLRKQRRVNVDLLRPHMDAIVTGLRGALTGKVVEPVKVLQIDPAQYSGRKLHGQPVEHFGDPLDLTAS